MATNRTADEQARLESEETARKEAELAAKEKVPGYRIVPSRRPPDIALPSDGNTMGLTIANPDNLKETMPLEKELSRVNGLRVVLTGGDARGGTFMCISIDRPIDLPGILNKMPMVGAVSGSGKRLLVALKSYNS